MRYNKRATVIRTLQTNTPLGIEEQEVPEVLPCYAQNVDFAEVATIYGGSVTEALKLHFQQAVQDVDKVFFNGNAYDVIATRLHKRTTVLYLERSGHNG